MYCSKSASNIFAYIHSLSVVYIIIMTIYNIYYLEDADTLARNLGSMVIIRILMRLPNQICVASHDSNGWVSVAESVVSLISVLVMDHLIKKQQDKNND